MKNFQLLKAEMGRSKFFGSAIHDLRSMKIESAIHDPRSKNENWIGDPRSEIKIWIADPKIFSHRKIKEKYQKYVLRKLKPI